MDGLGIYHTWPIIILGAAQLAYFIAMQCVLAAFAVFDNTTMIVLSAVNAGLAIAGFAWSVYKLHKSYKRSTSDEDLARYHSDVSFTTQLLITSIVEVIVVCIAAARYVGTAAAPDNLAIIALVGSGISIAAFVQSHGFAMSKELRTKSKKRKNLDDQGAYSRA